MLLQEEAFTEFQETMTKHGHSDTFLLTRGAVSISNEYYVLKAIAAIARVRLVSYHHSYKENLETLLDESIPMFTNARNTVAFVGFGSSCLGVASQ